MLISVSPCLTDLQRARAAGTFKLGHVLFFTDADGDMM